MNGVIPPEKGDVRTPAPAPSGGRAKSHTLGIVLLALLAAAAFIALLVKGG